SGFADISATGSLSITVKDEPLEGPRLAMVLDSNIPVNVREEFTSSQESGAANTGNAVVVQSARSQMPNPRGPRSYLNVFLTQDDGLQEGRPAALRPAAGLQDDSLVLEKVQPGRYWVRVDSARGYAYSISSGGVDLLHNPLVVLPGASVAPI